MGGGPTLCSCRGAQSTSVTPLVLWVCVGLYACFGLYGCVLGTMGALGSMGVGWVLSVLCVLWVVGFCGCVLGSMGALHSLDGRVLWLFVGFYGCFGFYGW